MNRQVILILFLIGTLAATISCDNKMVYEKYISIPELKWHVDSLINFNVNIPDSTQNHNLYFNIRNSVNYPFRNLWLFISVTPPNGEILTDTVEFTLAAPNGKWMGKGHGKFRDNQFIYRRNVYFPNPGQYNFQIQHGMRTPELNGVSDIGIRVEKLE